MKIEPVDEARLAEIDEREKAATRGPWTAVRPPWIDSDGAPWITAGPSGDPHAEPGVVVAMEIVEWEGGPDDGPDYAQAWADVEFIEGARRDIPDLVAALRKERAEAEDLRQAAAAALSDPPAGDHVAIAKYLKRWEGVLRLAAGTAGGTEGGKP